MKKMLGEQMENLRNVKGINQVEMAKILCVAMQSVSNWENENIMPSVDMLVKIANYFGTTADFLLGLSENHALNADVLNESTKKNENQ